MSLVSEKEAATLKKLYYDESNPAAFGGASRLHRAAKGIKFEKVKHWLRGERTYTLHRQPRRRFPRNRVIAFDRNELWEADLVQMLHLASVNDNYKYILTVIDVLSKFAYAVPLKNKTPDEVIRAFQHIFDTWNVTPKLLHTDKGGEFLGHKIQTFFKQKKIHHYVTQNDDIKASVVERFNRTLKGLMYRYFTYKESDRYIEILDKLMHSYNNSWHRSIRMRPADVTTKEKIAQAYKNLYPHSSPSAKAPTNHKVGDHVRLLFKEDKFTRGFKPHWTEEVFVISEVKRRRPFNVFSVKDLKGEAVQGNFYSPELQKVDEPQTFIIDKVLKTRQRRGHPKEYFVSWLGYKDPKFNSWVTDINRQDGS